MEILVKDQERVFPVVLNARYPTRTAAEGKMLFQVSSGQANG